MVLALMPRDPTWALASPLARGCANANMEDIDASEIAGPGIVAASRRRLYSL